jgi:CMP-N-acetylneuraminic acid synthetase
MSTIAIITARSGSKSVPNKNVRKLGNKPLLGWVMEAVSKSKLVDKIILSTDSEEYFKIGKSFNKNLIFHKRSKELAEDVPSENVLLDTIKQFSELFSEDSLIVLIQPTTPFLKNSDIDSCIKKMKSNPKINTCISVKQVSEYPDWMISKIDSETGKGKDFSGELSVRQNLDTLWIVNGGCYVMKKEFLEKHQKIIDYDKTLVHEMSKISSMDIDDEEDFKICESLVNNNFINF